MVSIQTGSRAFFGDIPDFKPHDTDMVYICERGEMRGFLHKRFMKNAAGDGCDFFIVRDTKENLMQWELKHAQPMSLGHYLLPDFCREFGITMADLETLRPLRDRLDTMHQYVGLIYDAYIENGSMTLTDEQRMGAYEEYKRERKNIKQ